MVLPPKIPIKNPNPNLDQFSITIINGYRDNKIYSDNTTSSDYTSLLKQFFSKHDIRDDKDGRAFIGASFKSHTDDSVVLGTDINDIQFVKRNSNNINLYYFLTLDYDDGMTFDEAIEKFGDKYFSAYTTHSHDENKIQKFRIVFPLANPVKPEDIEHRKDDILGWAESVDNSTLDISRLFYLPSCPKENKDQARIHSNEGELLDVMSFKLNDVKPDKPTKGESKNNTEHKPFGNATKESIKAGLKQIGKVGHDPYYKIAAAMFNGGMTMQDFFEVSEDLKPNYNQEYWQERWKYSCNLHDVSPGFLINLLKEYNITILQKKKVTTSTAMGMLQLELDSINKQVELLNKSDKLSFDESQQLKKLNVDLINKEQQIEEEKDKGGNTFNNDMIDLLDRRQIYYVANTGLIHEYFPNGGRWDEYKIHNFVNSELFLMDEQNAGDLLLKFLKWQNRSYLSMGLSAKTLPKTTLNRFRTDHWLQPLDGEPHEIFDIFFRSLGDNKEENIKHLKQVIGWKYLNPSDYKLPCLVIYGEGGVGKNLLVDDLLASVFGKHQVLAIQQSALNSFNGAMAGKMVVFIDESTSDKANMEKMKAMIGRPDININEKFVKPYVADNISMFITGGNGAKGAVFLGRDKSDRRFSILKVTNSVIDHVMEVKNLNKDEAVEWWYERLHLLSDKKSVAVWLNHVVNIANEIKVTPQALHGVDYKNLLNVQSGPLEWIVDNVFDHPDFKYIPVSECYGLYKLKCEEFGTFHKLTRQVFSATINESLHKKLPHIEQRPKQKVRQGKTGKETCKSSWVLSSTFGTVDYSNICYVDEHPSIKGKPIVVEEFYPVKHNSKFGKMKPNHLKLVE